MVDPLFVLLAFCLIFFFIAVAMAIASLTSEKKTGSSQIKSRLTRLTSAPETLKQELATGIKIDQERKSLLADIDLKPLLGKFTGEAYFANVEQDLARADIPLRVSEFLILRAVFALIGAGTVLILTKNVIFTIVALAVASFLHAPIIHIKKAMRIKKFTNQLAEFLVLVVNSLRAGQSFMQGCSVAVAESPNPIAAEFKQVIKEVNLGMPEADSLENLLTRVPSEELKIVVSGYIIQRKVGGNLAEILEKTAETIRERIKIQGQINTLTTQGKLSGAIVAGLPFVIGFGVSAINPDYMKPLIGTVPGYIVCAIAIGMQLTGAFIIWRIVNIEI
jgi:tight adherence protein B